MARRTPKPFTVEVRKGGRSVKAAAAPWPADPMRIAMDDQPRVFWPGLEEASEPVPEAQERAAAAQPTSGRVLPALDEPKPLVKAPQPKRRGRIPAKPKPAAAEDLPIEAHAQVELHKPFAEQPDRALAIVSGAKARANTVFLRHGRKRVLRSDFKRGEKWKARLPIAVLRSRR